MTPVAPPDGKYGGVAVPAVRLRVSDRRAYDPVLAAVALLTTIRAEQGDSLRLQPARFDRLAGTDQVRRALEAGREAAAVARAWEPALERFRDERRPYLLYPDR